MNRKYIILIVVFFIGLIGGTLFYFNSRQVSFITAKTGDVVESIYGLGTVTSDKVYRFKAGTALVVKKVYVNEGDLVRVGTPLITMDQNTMRSPIEGTVTLVAYKEGELVTPQVPIVTVTNLRNLFLEVSLEQQSILRVKKGQKVLVSFESLRSEKFEGEVASIYPRDSQFIVRVELKNWPEAVLPGMTADVAILVGKKENVILIPIRSIVAGKVTRLKNSSKEVLSVKLGVLDQEWAEITSGNINPGDQLLIRK